jgi:hypothetical protein
MMMAFAQRSEAASAPNDLFLPRIDLGFAACDMSRPEAGEDLSL